MPFWRGPGEDWHRPAPLLPFSFSQDDLTVDRAPHRITGPGGSGRSSSPDRRAGFRSATLAPFDLCSDVRHRVQDVRGSARSL